MEWSRASRRLAVVVVLLVVLAGGLVWLAVFLHGQHLERASQWSGIVSVFVAIAALVPAVASMWLGWQMWKGAGPPSDGLVAGGANAPEAPSINARDIPGIASIGDDTINIQHR